jgi:hypothetical protein
MLPSISTATVAGFLGSAATTAGRYRVGDARAWRAARGGFEKIDLLCECFLNLVSCGYG